MRKLLSGFVLLLIFCSCSQDSPVQSSEISLIANPSVWSFLSNGEKALLSIQVSEGIDTFDSAQWYESNEEGELVALIEGANTLEYEVEAFDDKDIKYFVCQVKKDGITETSKIFAVAHTGLPVVSITTDGSEINKKDWLDDTQIDINGSPLAGSIKGRGNSSWRFPKKSFSLKLSEKSFVLEMLSHKRWVLISNIRDSSLLRNYFAAYLGNKVFTGKGWNPSFKFVDLVMNGEYWGNYIIGEQIKIDENRVNIQDIEKKGIGKGGFIVEVNFWRDEDFNFVTERNVIFSLKDPDKVSSDIQEYVKETIQNAENILFSDDFADPDNGYANVFDVGSVVDWYLVNEITANLDAAFQSSVYMYYDNKDGKIHMGPNWDFDLSSGNSQTEANNWHIKNSIWMQRFFQDENFEDKVKERYKQVRDSLYEAVNGIKTVAETISVSASLDYSRWEIDKDYKAQVDELVNWLRNRLDFLDEQWL
ncbi:MAG: CotH kinase family protein [Spirochaetales bacterium]|nr:CotH kinase family protein [Spirochaetales bacterium]